MIVKDLDSVGVGFDVIIVGAGTAGCALAVSLSSSLRVLLVDSKDFPRKKACSGILVREGIDFFEGELDEGVLVEPNTLDINYIDWNNSLQKLSKKDFLNTDRFLFDDFLFNLVRNKKNIFFLKNTSFIEFTSSPEKNYNIVLLESNGLVKSIVSKYLVGCDGALSRIRRRIDNKNIRFYIGMQEFIESDLEIKNASFIFDDEITDFYAWVIPKKPFIEIGALVDPKDSKEKFSLFKNKVKKEFGITGDGAINSAVVLRPSSINEVCLGKDFVFLCGEAAGLISPSSAEGISYALRSAKFCAEAINSSKDPLKDYSKKMVPVLKRLETKFSKAKMLSNKETRKKIFD